MNEFSSLTIFTFLNLMENGRYKEKKVESKLKVMMYRDGLVKGVVVKINYSRRYSSAGGVSQR